MQYTLSLTTRMMTIAGLCLLLLCVLLFLLGVEIGKRVALPVEGAMPAMVIPAVPAPVTPLATASELPSAPAAAKP
ncbi:hypothetical protein [Polaromonas sp. UC242_47]|uniref:hypothetical protein n=1 Tax=Polaromonas sp. UC242_47 TaxID=3374626 RepID=UPI0037934175